MTTVSKPNPFSTAALALPPQTEALRIAVETGQKALL